MHLSFAATPGEETGQDFSESYYFRSDSSFIFSSPESALSSHDQRKTMKAKDEKGRFIWYYFVDGLNSTSRAIFDKERIVN